MSKDKFMEKKYGRYSQQHIEAIKRENSVCLLPKGHKGNHKWTLSKNVNLEIG